MCRVMLLLMQHEAPIVTVIRNEATIKSRKFVYWAADPVLEGPIAPVASSTTCGGASTSSSSATPPTSTPAVGTAARRVMILGVAAVVLCWMR